MLLVICSVNSVQLEPPISTGFGFRYGYLLILQTHVPCFVML